MTSVKTFKFLAECDCDISVVLDAFRAKYNVSNVSATCSECEFSITGDVELVDLIKIATECDDCHYVEETINYIEEYTGERIYRNRLDDFN